MDRSRLHDLLEAYLENRLNDADRAELGAELASSRGLPDVLGLRPPARARRRADGGTRGYAMALRERARPRIQGRPARTTMGRDRRNRRRRRRGDRRRLGALRPRRPARASAAEPHSRDPAGPAITIPSSPGWKKRRARSTSSATPAASPPRRGKTCSPDTKSRAARAVLRSCATPTRRGWSWARFDVRLMPAADAPGKGVPDAGV